MWELIKLLYKIPPEAYTFAARLLEVLVGNESREIKARRAQAVASKEIAEAAIKRALK
jgi:hypothetical protein